MIDTKAIRAKVLDLALRGKLTEQRPEDGTAEELFQRIQEEKQALTERGIISAEKPLPEISQNEIPFAIPDNWKWIRHNSIFDISGGSQPAKNNFVDQPQEGYIQLYQIRDYGDRPQPVYIPIGMAMKTTKAGDILLARYGGSLGKVFWAKDGAYNVALAKIVYLFNQGSINAHYLYYYYHGPIYRNFIQSISRSAQSGFNRDDLKSLLFPLPPLAEQKRIVEKIESIFPILDTIDALQSAYAANQKVLRAKLIDAAIRGQLTEQLPEDGTAEELYRQIQQEKAALEKAGKIKKSKPLPPISDEEKPFDIPDNWKWVSVGDVCTNIQYGTSKKSSETGKMPVIRMGNLQGGKIVYDKLAYTSDDNEIAKYPLEINDLLFNRTNSMELVGKTAIYKGEMPAIYAGYLVRITPLLLVSDYLNYVMQTKYYWDYCRIVRIEANGQSNINAEKLKRFVFPLPPLTEQKRIVAKLEKLLPLCEKGQS